MSPLSRRVTLILLLSAVAGCSSVKDSTQSVKNSVGGLFGGDSTLNTTTEKKAAGDSVGATIKNTATLRINKYVDQRKSGNPRLLGIATNRVRGVDGELLLDQEIANLVTTAIKKRFDSEGYQVLEGNALFEVSGVIKDLTLNVKNRDEINIAIETTLKESATGKIVWSGLVTEKNDRFAGVSGNNKDDVVAYLNKELRVASDKTVEAVNSSLIAVQPALFNLPPGAKVVPGVTVYAAPAAVTNPAPATPVAPATVMPSYVPPPASAVPLTAYKPLASANAGLLLVNTSPSRAKVYLDGVYYGLSPLRLEMEPGVYATSVKLQGYKMVTEKVSVRKGDSTEVELNLER